MEVLLPDGERRKKWKMDGITYYFKAGKLCQCKSRNPRLREGRKKDGWKLVKTSAQEKSIAVFRMMVYLKRYYFQQITGIPVWDMAPGVAGQTRLTKFHHANAEACDERGVANYPAFRFSVGPLFRPVNARAERQGWVISVVWENREDRELSRASDWLRVGYFYDSYPTSPRLFPGVVARREECRAEFTIPDSGLASTETLHLYLFFSRQDKVAFSESTYLRV